MMRDETSPDVKHDAFGSAWDSFQGRVILHLMKRAAKLLRPGTGVTEIMINGPDEVYLEKGGKLWRTRYTFDDAAAVRALARAILQFSGKRLQEHELSSEARLPDLSRVHIVQDPAAKPFQRIDGMTVNHARPGICIAIRRFQQETLNTKKIVGSGTLTDDAMRFLEQKIIDRKNIIVSGGTGTGKTTLLNILSESMGEQERIVVIEDSSELQIQRPHVVQFETVQPDRHNRGGISIRELFRAALRMRPDRIVVGECRGGEALDMVQAMSSGHAGSLSTVHADTPKQAITRLETLCLMAELDLPLAAIRRQLGEAIDTIVQLERVGQTRLVTAISEVTEKDGTTQTRPVFLRRGQGALLRVDDAGLQ